MIDDLCQFLDGRTEPIVTRLQSEMEQAAEELRFEQAAALRDQMPRASRTVVERQKVISTEYIDSDVIAMARADGEACVQIFFIRGGKLIGREYFLLEGTEDNSDCRCDGRSSSSSSTTRPPACRPRCCCPHEVEEAQIIRHGSARRDDREGGDQGAAPRQQQELIQMAPENACETLHALQAQWQADRHRQEQALASCKRPWDLSGPLNRIECYDISNTQGTAAVGSMVVFEQGIPKKKLYRHFNIRSVSGPDDFASMEEVLTRRFKRWQAAPEMAEAPGKKPDPSFSLLPDLLLVDGGKGQLSRAVAVLERFDLLGKLPVAGLAKQNEELFLPGSEAPVMLPRQSQGLYLVQRIRDEAHRFAISSHRNLRTRKGMASRLDAIPGIGPARRVALLNHFGSLSDIQEASVEELSAVPGITKTLAQTIKERLE